MFEDVFFVAETWPFLVTLLTKCVSLEISGSKKRLPKLNVAKTLRIVVQRAEDAKFSGTMYYTYIYLLSLLILFSSLCKIFRLFLFISCESKCTAIMCLFCSCGEILKRELHLHIDEFHIESAHN